MEEGHYRIRDGGNGSISGGSDSANHQLFEFEWGDYLGVLVLCMLPLLIMPALILLCRLIAGMISYHYKRRGINNVEEYYYNNYYNLFRDTSTNKALERPSLFQRLVVFNIVKVIIERKHYRRKLEIILKATDVGVYWVMFQVLLSFLACMVYAVETYFPHKVPEWTIVFELLVTAIFLFDYLLYFFISQDSMKYVFSTVAIIDLFAIFPVFFSLIPGLFFQFAFFTAIFRSLRVLRSYRLVDFTTNEVQRQVFVLILSVAALVFCSTTIIQNLESREYLIQLLNQTTSSSGINATYLEFHNAFYLIVVTFATVGYGDITCKTTAGRMAMVLLIIIGLFVISVQTSRLIIIFNSRAGGKYGGSYRKTDGEHIVVLGDISLPGLIEFLKELFSGEKYKKSKKVVVMSNIEPSFETKSILAHPYFSSRVTFLLGTPMSPKDLQRAAVGDSQACYILSDKYAPNPRASDKGTILRFLAVRRLYPHINSCAQIILPESKRHIGAEGAFNSDSYVICAHEMKMGLVSRSCIAPGFSTLVSNLVKTFFLNDLMNNRSILAPGWETLYYNGCVQSVYGMRLPSIFDGKTFGSVCLDIYLRYEAMIFAMEVEVKEDQLKPPSTESERKKTTIILHPGRDYTVHEGDFVFLIASNPGTCTLIKKFEYEFNNDPRDVESEISETALNTPDRYRKEVGAGPINAIFRSSPDLTHGRDFEHLEDYYDSHGEANDVYYEDQEITISLEDTILLQIYDSPWRSVYDILEQPSPSSSRYRETLLIQQTPSSSFQSISDAAPVIGSEDIVISTPINTRYFISRSDPASEIQKAYIVENHIIVYAEPNEWVLNFIAPLRSVSLASFQPIVFLHPSKPTSTFLHIISHFKEVYFIRGTPMVTYDLHRAGIRVADKLVVLTGSKSKQNSMADNDAILKDEYLLDADAIITLRSILSQYPQLSFSIVELAYASSLKVIGTEIDVARTKKKWNLLGHTADVASPDYYNNHLYVSGNAFMTCIIDSMISQVLSNKFILHIVNLLIIGRHSSSPITKSSQVFQISLPSGFEGQSYGELVQFLLLEKDILPLGLYRTTHEESGIGNSGYNRYVHTNPKPSDILRNYDLVYVISLKDPRDATGPSSPPPLPHPDYTL